MGIIDFIKLTANKLLKKRFFRYCFGGGVAAITDMGIFFILNEIFLVHYLLALTISFPVAVIVNYALQRRVTFKNKYSKKHKQFTVFLIIQIIGWGINASVTTGLVELAHFWPTMARIVAIFIVVLFTYNSNKMITFNLMK